MTLSHDIMQYIHDHQQETLDLLITLAKIPAPSHHEEKRAAFCKQWLEAQGAGGVYIDEALNVVYPVGCTENNPLVVYMAHTDVVFPDTEELPLVVEDGLVKCPGVGDDTANVVALLMVAKYIAQNRIQPKNVGLLLVANSCEEGLGNLKGCRNIMAKYGSRVQEFISFDGYGNKVTNRAVGSKRYKIEVDTEGGHSYSKFGNRNAIAYLASLINSLYAMKVPTRGKTTFNVGTISGGTSVNTIAQHAEMLYEFRSDNREDLAEMEAHMHAALAYYATKGIRITTTQVGDRPCAGDVDAQRQAALDTRAIAALRDSFGNTPITTATSTDCNIPLSMGIPSACLGCVNGGLAHTREEYISIDSLLPGQQVAFRMIMHHM